MFLQDLGYHMRVEGDLALGWVDVTEPVRVPGTDQIRVSVLATLSDVWTGVLAGQVVAPSLALTVDLTARILGDVGSDRIDIVGRIAKTGRTTTVADCEFRDPAGTLVAFSHATFVASPRPSDVIDLLPRSQHPEGVMAAPIVEALGIAERAPGVLEVARGAYVNQPSGTIQGGVLAVLAEAAAESLTGRRVLDLECRYLSGIRVGPAVTTTTRLNEDTVRVDVTDPGNHDRATTVAVARLAPAEAGRQR